MTKLLMVFLVVFSTQAFASSATVGQNKKVDCSQIMDGNTEVPATFQGGGSGNGVNTGGL